MFLWNRHLKNILMVLGVVLWVGALSPEIFVQAGLSCILDENGEELTAEDAREFMEAYFYGNPVGNQTENQDGGEAPVEIKYKFALLEWLQ